MADQFIEVIEEHGAFKFFGLVSDNASNNMKASWKQVESKYPHISPYGCLAHGLNLLLGDIMKNEMISSTIQNTKEIIKKVRNSHILKALLKEKSGPNFISLKLPVPTRWLSTENSLVSIISNEKSLKEVAIDDRSLTFMSSETRSTIILDPIFWSKLKSVRSFLFLIYKFIKMVEQDNPVLSKSYEVFYNLIEHVKEIPDDCFFFSEKDKFLKIIDSRKDFCLRPVHLAAYMLDPNLRGRYLSDDEKFTVVTFISEKSEHYFRSSCDVAITLKEYGDFLNKSFYFSNPILWKSAESFDPISWWNTMCPGKLLQSFATRILNLPTSSAACERSFSTHKDVHSQKRNRLTNERAANLVFIKYNLKVLYYCVNYK